MKMLNLQKSYVYWIENWESYYSKWNLMSWNDFVKSLQATDTLWRELISPLFTLFIVVSKHMYNGEVGEQ